MNLMYKVFINLKYIEFLGRLIEESDKLLKVKPTGKRSNFFVVMILIVYILFSENHLTKTKLNFKVPWQETKFIKKEKKEREWIVKIGEKEKREKEKEREGGRENEWVFSRVRKTGQKKHTIREKLVHMFKTNKYSKKQYTHTYTVYTVYKYNVYIQNNKKSN